MEKEELRKKIKQLKYKIEKEEGIHRELTAKTNQLKDLQLQELTTDRILKKINFKLNEKGMQFGDWLLSLQYDDPFNMETLLRIGERMGLQLDREESNILVNFIADDLSPTIAFDDLAVECNKSGIRLK